MSKKYLISTIMNQAIYAQIELRSRKSLFMFIYLLNKPSGSPTLDLIIKQVKLKHNNMFINKLINIMTQINYIHYKK